jgi:hypothetical protein
MKINIQHQIVEIDDEDWPLISCYKWCISKTSIYCSLGNKATTMGRLLLNIVDSDLQVDHKDGNFLNNKKENLRKATQSQNNANQIKWNGCYTSKYKGVTWSKKARAWQAQIAKNGKRFFLGYYSTEENAAKAYDEKALKLYGEFARFNLQ